MIDLKDRSALVTGSTQGVGQAIAIGLARAGANVVVHGLREDDSARETVAILEKYNHVLSWDFQRRAEKQQAGKKNYW